jgi:hypothetical protein
MQTIKVTKTINAPLRYVFNWCTDFREDDPALTNSNGTRKILEKTKKRVVYAQLDPQEDGTQKIGVDYVTLKPPNSWHLEYFGEDDNELGEYKLTSLGKSKTKLTMIFKESWKLEKVPTIEEQVASTSRSWDQFVAALEQDYNSGK